MYLMGYSNETFGSVWEMQLSLLIRLLFLFPDFNLSFFSKPVLERSLQAMPSNANLQLEW